jgi:protein phosphatase
MMGSEQNAETAIMPSPVMADEEALRRNAPLVRVKFGAANHRGRVRSNNEDHYLISRISRSFGVLMSNLPDGELPGQVEDAAYAMVVADGMGGLAAGEQASRLAIRTGVRLVLESPKWSLSLDDREIQELMDRMRDYFFKVDEVLIANSKRHRGLEGMGTTLTVVYSVGAAAFVVHAGDSRAYLFRGGKLVQLTRDHTVAQLLADTGAITPEEISTHAHRHHLTNFAGGPSSGIMPEIDTLRLQDGDRILLCTDGLTDMVEDASIAATLSQQPEPQPACQALIDRALAAGGRDNVTALVARYEVPKGTIPVK